MNKLVLEALLEFIFWWSLFTAGYAASIFTLDWLFSAWQKRRTSLQTERVGLEHINAEMHASVGRLTTEFLAAQQAIRSDARQEVDRH